MNFEENAIDILNMLCGTNGCVVSDSGGKDSSVLKHIAMKCREKYGLEFKIQHNHTTVDAPETVWFVKKEQEKYRNLGIEFDILYPKRSMWQLIADKGMPPTRLARYCCAELKEYSGIGEKLVTGVRKSESVNRSKNQGAVTFPKPSKELYSKTENDENFILTNKGGWFFTI